SVREPHALSGARRDREGAVARRAAVGDRDRDGAERVRERARRPRARVVDRLETLIRDHVPVPRDPPRSRAGRAELDVLVRAARDDERVEAAGAAVDAIGDRGAGLEDELVAIVARAGEALEAGERRTAR